MNCDGNLAALGRHEAAQERAERRWERGLALAQESDCPDCDGREWWHTSGDNRLVCVARVKDGDGTYLCGYVLDADAIGEMADDEDEGLRERAAEERAEMRRDDAERGA